MKTIRGGSVAALAALACVAAGASAAPALAWSGQSLWVGTAATAAGGASCAAPGYNSIQAAINAATAGQQIVVCAGTYAEQLQITKPVEISARGTVIVQLPATPANSTTTCDQQMASGNPGNPHEQDQDEISVCGPVQVSLTGITVDAAWVAGTCYDALYGIVAAGGATVRIDKSQVVAAGAVPLNGCQGGIGILAGDSASTPAQVGHLVLTNSTVSGYQKGGVVIDGTGSTGVMDNDIVTGIGATAQIAQNGIQIGDGAGGSVSNTTVSANECDYPSVCGADGVTQTQSAGILIVATDAPVSVIGDKLTGNDIGVYYQADPGKPAPVTPTAVIDDDRFDGNRYEAVQLDQGAALVENSELSGGNVGVEAIQYSGQTFGINSVVSDITIRNMSVATVEVLSDRATGDKPGVLVVSGSQINPSRVLNNSRNVRLVELADS